MLDVNAGIPLSDEPAILAEAIQAVQSVTDVPLCIDSSIVEALERGLAVYRGKPLVNSVTGEEDRLEKVLPLVAGYKAAVVGVANDETGISDEVGVRFAIAKKIVERAERFGIPRDDVIIDPLAMPIGAVPAACVTLFALVRRLREELGVNTICGASNVSFGLVSLSDGSTCYSNSSWMSWAFCFWWVCSWLFSADTRSGRRISPGRLSTCCCRPGCCLSASLALW
jgi:5-methyltetrahydrofolate--homocysteine methyltransferase